MDHAHLEEIEEERVREFTGEADAKGHHHSASMTSEDDLPHAVFHDYAEDGSIISNDDRGQQFPAAVPVSREEWARRERAGIAKAQAAKFGKDAREASRRGEWVNEELGSVPKDAADRLRTNIPYKFKIRKSWYSL